jgi:hypothetical protein
VCLRQELADAARLSAEIQGLLEDDAARVAMADASRAVGRPSATRDVAADLLAFAGIPERGMAKRNDAGSASVHPSQVGAGGPG